MTRRKPVFAPKNRLCPGAKKILAEVTEIELPEFRVRRSASAPDGKQFSIENTEPPSHVQVNAIEFVDHADAIMTLEDGRQIYVRLIAKAMPRLSDPKQTLLAEIVIDIADPELRTADPETMRKHITLAPEARYWCHLVRAGELIMLAEAEVQRQADLYWKGLDVGTLKKMPWPRHPHFWQAKGKAHHQRHHIARL